ncbi:MAG: allophanate hydrolase, partial [Verrucomicrobiota bacterium]
MKNDFPLDRAGLHERYRSGALTPRRMLEHLLERMEADTHPNIWISNPDPGWLLEQADRLAETDLSEKPLYGLPFAIKDNIDLAGLPTTAGCPDYAYQPDRSAFVVERLMAAGALPIGKTNLDQFATGLVGIRSPYGLCGNAFNPAYIPGGSSSGSAVAVARGLATFSLGTDTAGSGRIPAAFNNLLGLKPTRGAVSNSGVVPACRSLDCVSIFCLTAADGQAILNVAADYDPEDPYARRVQHGPPLPPSFRFGVLPDAECETFGDDDCRTLYRAAIEHMKDLGGHPVEIDFEPFRLAARLLYEGPWVTERFVAIERFLTEQPDSVYPVTRKIIEGGRQPSAADAFKAAYELQALRRRSEATWDEVLFVMTPTAGTIYTI